MAEQQQPGYPMPQYPQGGYPPPQQGYPQGDYPPPQGYGAPGGYPPAPPGAPQPAPWMAKPEVSTPCPPGLEYLTMVDQILVHQTVEIFEAITGWENSNKYKIKNSVGQVVYMAAEESGCLMRQCCGARRGFDMKIVDNYGREVLKVHRALKICAGCCWCAAIDCCAFDVTVELPTGEVMGTVRQSCSAWKPRFEVFDHEGNSAFTMAGPCCVCECPCFDIDFNLYNSDGEEVGKINKQWSGIAKEIFVDSDNFGISFPMNTDVKLKATLLGAVFLIDFMYFESAGNNRNNN